jgi:hypothetical protein
VIDETDWRERLAAEIADGGEVDWTGAATSAHDPAVSDFRDLERLARAFSTAARLAPRATARGGEPALFNWGGLEVLARFGRRLRRSSRLRSGARRNVALKLRRSDRARSNRAVSAISEGRRLARVRHRTSRSGAAVTTDGWDSGPSSSWRAEGGWSPRPLTAEETVRIGLDLASALAAIHGELAHSDVKAANVLLEAGPDAGRASRAGRVVLADLSAARGSTACPEGARRNSSLDGAGTRRSPGPSSDLYALGRCSSACCRRHPVEAATLEAATQHRSSPPPSCHPATTAAALADVDRASPATRRIGASTWRWPRLWQPAREPARSPSRWRAASDGGVGPGRGLWPALAGRRCGALALERSPRALPQNLGEPQPRLPLVSGSRSSQPALRSGPRAPAPRPGTRSVASLTRAAGSRPARRSQYALAQARHTLAAAAPALEPARTAFRLATGLLSSTPPHRGLLLPDDPRLGGGACPARGRHLAGRSRPRALARRARICQPAQDALTLLDSSKPPAPEVAMRACHRRCSAYSRTGDWPQLPGRPPGPIAARLQHSPTSRRGPSS